MAHIRPHAADFLLTHRQHRADGFSQTRGIRKRQAVHAMAQGRRQVIGVLQDRHGPGGEGFDQIVAERHADAGAGEKKIRLGQCIQPAFLRNLAMLGFAQHERMELRRGEPLRRFLRPVDHFRGHGGDGFREHFTPGKHAIDIADDVLVVFPLLGVSAEKNPRRALVLHLIGERQPGLHRDLRMHEYRECHFIRPSGRAAARSPPSPPAWRLAARAHRNP